MLRVVVLRVLFFVDMEATAFSVADLYCSVAFTLSWMQIN